MGGFTTSQDQQFRLLVENVQEYAIFMLDPHGYVSTWNAGAERIKGYRADEIVGRHYSRFYLAEDAESRKPDRLLEIARERGACEDEGWRLRKDGSRFWANVVITAAFDPTGQLHGFSKVVRDLSDHQYALQRTLLAELGQTALHTDNLKSLLDETIACVVKGLKTDLCGIFRPLPGGSVLRLEAGAEWPGDAEARAVVPAGKHSHPGYTLVANRPIVSDDLGRETRFASPPTFQDAGIASGAGVVIPGSDRPYGVLGAYSRLPRHFTESDTLFLQSVAHVLGTAIDRRHAYKALKDANRTLSTLIRSTPVGIVAYGPDGSVQQWNPAAEQLYQWRADEVIGRPDPSISVDRAVDEALVSRRARTESASNSIVVRRRRRDGEPLDVALSTAPLDGADGAPETLLTVHCDITRQTRFLQIAAHELRNPMAVLKALLGMFKRQAKKGAPAGDLASKAEVMNRELDRLSTLFDQVLAAFETQEGKFVLKRDLIDLADVIDRAIGPFQQGPNGSRIVVEHPQADLPLWGDAMRIQEVVRNLVENALRHSPPDRPVRVGAERQASWAVISVGDEGPGICAEEMEHIFEPFFRGGDVAGRPEGLGLGLYICRDIVERHGGKIWVESDAEGTTFSFGLPLEREAAKGIAV